MSSWLADWVAIMVHYFAQVRDMWGRTISMWLFHIMVDRVVREWLYQLFGDEAAKDRYGAVVQRFHEVVYPLERGEISRLFLLVSIIVYICVNK